MYLNLTNGAVEVHVLFMLFNSTEPPFDVELFAIQKSASLSQQQALISPFTNATTIRCDYNSQKSN